MNKNKVELFEKMLQELPEDKQTAIRSLITNIETTAYQGPLPPPIYLDAYNKVLPGAADRIIAMAEKQLNERTQKEMLALKLPYQLASRGQILGFLLAFACLVLTGFLAFTGHDTVAGVIGGGTIVSLAVIFVTGKHIEQKKSVITQEQMRGK